MHWIRAILQNIKEMRLAGFEEGKLTTDIVNEINIKIGKILEESNYFVYYIL